MAYDSKLSWPIRQQHVTTLVQPPLFEEYINFHCEEYSWAFLLSSARLQKTFRKTERHNVNFHKLPLTLNNQCIQSI